MLAAAPSISSLSRAVCGVNLLYKIADSDFKTFDEPSLMQAQLGTLDGRPVGVFTDAVGPFHPTASRGAEAVGNVTYLAHVASLQKIVLDERLTVWPHWQVPGSARPTPTVANVPRTSFREAVCRLDGSLVGACETRFWGVDFLFSQDVQSHPFVVFRLPGEVLAWPALRSQVLA